VKGGITTRLVKLRNPWGNNEFSGEWCDSSDQWTDKLRKEVGLEDADDGVFFMSLEDFVQYYVIFSICKIHPDYNHSSIKIKKDQTLKPVLTVMEVQEDGKYFIQIHQKNPRFILKNGKYPVNGFMFLMLLDEKYNYLASRCSNDYFDTLKIVV